jgi:hypothetical protein
MAANSNPLEGYFTRLDRCETAIRELQPPLSFAFIVQHGQHAFQKCSTDLNHLVRADFVYEGHADTLPDQLESTEESFTWPTLLIPERTNTAAPPEAHRYCQMCRGPPSVNDHRVRCCDNKCAMWVHVACIGMHEWRQQRLESIKFHCSGHASEFVTDND